MAVDVAALAPAPAFAALAAQQGGAWVLGVGLRTCAPATALQALWQQAQQRLGFGGAAPLCTVAVLQGKEQHPALHAWLATALPGLCVQAVPLALLAAQPVHTQSARLQERYDTGCVAEAVALAAAGSGAQLLLPRLVAPDGSATLAVACRFLSGVSV